MAVDPWSSDSEEAPLRRHRQGKSPGALFGVAFSGGGIRSATFNLGFVQSLVRHRLLGRIDYLSTVSGGGYIGGWLSALIRRSGLSSGEITADHLAGPIAHLRRYSNYLTPRYGVFSTDTLAAVANLIRNLILNQSLLICCLAALLVLPLLAAEHATAARSMATTPFALIAFALLVVGSTAIATGLQRIDARERGSGQALRAYFGVACGLAATVLIAAAVGRSAMADVAPARLGFTLACLYFFSWTLGWLLATPLARNGREKRPDSTATLGARLSKLAWFFVAPLIAGAVFGTLVTAYGEAARGAGASIPFALAFGGPFLLIVVCVACAFHIGMGKRWFRESMREWLGRAGGLCLAAAIAWALVFGAAFYGPAILAYLKDWTLSGGVAWASASGAGIWMARGDKTGGKPGSAADTRSWRDWVAQAAPYVFIIGLLFLLAGGLHQGMALADTVPEAATVCPMPPDTPGTQAPAGVAGEWQRFSAHVQRIEAERCQISEAHPRLLLGVFIGLMALAALLAWRVDINMFSMHQFYRNRLTRCYLGASNPQRKPDPFTDFDLRDDLGLADLASQRPIHLLNCALNLTEVEALQWQERLAAPFVFSPAHCGYRFCCDGRTLTQALPTTDYLNGRGWRSGLGRGPYLGTAIAASGAAANPNQGYHTAPALAFIMTFFNVRLGRWVPNPGSPNPNLESPTFGLFYLLRELFARTNENTRFVNLSDGGHFENLGLYELVRRRCRLIVVCDAGCDPAPFGFEDLGNAVRKCRNDFGAEIHLDLAPLVAAGDERRRFAIGRIDYAAGGTGVLVYVKPLVAGDEPADIRHYHAAHEEFPHQTTADQWFDESQFESYRKLGELSGDALFAGHPWNLDARLGSDEWIEAIATRLAQAGTAPHR